MTLEPQVPMSQIVCPLKGKLFEATRSCMFHRHCPRNHYEQAHRFTLEQLTTSSVTSCQPPVPEAVNSKIYWKSLVGYARPWFSARFPIKSYDIQWFSRFPEDPKMILHQNMQGFQHIAIPCTAPPGSQISELCQEIHPWGVPPGPASKIATFHRESLNLWG